MQHVEEAASLRDARSALVRAPHVQLRHLQRLDDRLAAHLDGITVAGEYGRFLSRQALERPGTGEVFLSTVGAIEERDPDQLDRLLAIAETIPLSCAGLLSAFGWVSAANLSGTTRHLLEAPQPWPREVALAACAMHAVDPGVALARAIRDDDANLRARGLRVAGRCGRRDLLEVCLASLTDADERCSFEAARSAVLLGDRTESLMALEAHAMGAGSGASSPNVPALDLALKVVSPKRARALLASLARDPTLIRTVIRGVAIAGDPHYVPWLLEQMRDLMRARLAGEAFSFITGLDLAHSDLEREPPEDVELGPNDDPDDDDVSMDEDENLPWPDLAKLTSWWHSNGAHFAAGRRYFVGAVPTPATCLDVLKAGFQRQRSAAAEYLSLFCPGIPLFNTAAPAWRQQRLLTRMVA
jgi:uncharacterized protein (TIGR02270 family)